MSIRPVATGGAGAQRFRMVLTDGTTSAPAMLASQLNGHIQSGKLQDYTMIRLDKYMTNDLNNQK